MRKEKTRGGVLGCARAEGDWKVAKKTGPNFCRGPQHLASTQGTETVKKKKITTFLVKLGGEKEGAAEDAKYCATQSGRQRGGGGGGRKRAVGNSVYGGELLEEKT